MGRSRTNTHNVWKETTQKGPGDNAETKHFPALTQNENSTRSHVNNDYRDLITP